MEQVLSMLKGLGSVPSNKQNKEIGKYLILKILIWEGKRVSKRSPNDNIEDIYFISENPIFYHLRSLPISVSV